MSGRMFYITRRANEPTCIAMHNGNCVKIKACRNVNRGITWTKGEVKCIADIWSHKLISEKQRFTKCFTSVSRRWALSGNPCFTERLNWSVRITTARKQVTISSRSCCPSISTDDRFWTELWNINRRAQANEKSADSQLTWKVALRKRTEPRRKHNAAAI